MCGPRRCVRDSKPTQVAVAVEALREQREVEPRGRCAPEPDARRKHEALVGRQVAFLAEDARRLDHDLAPDDGLDAGPLRLLVEADRAREALVVGQGERGHLELAGTFDERVERRRTVHEAEARVDVKVDESAGHLNLDLLSSPGCRREATRARAGRTRGRRPLHGQALARTAETPAASGPTTNAPTPTPARCRRRGSACRCGRTRAGTSRSASHVTSMGSSARLAAHAPSRFKRSDARMIHGLLSSSMTTGSRPCCSSHSSMG